MQNIAPVNDQTNAGIDLYGSKMNKTDTSYYVAVLMLMNKNVFTNKLQQHTFKILSSPTYFFSSTYFMNLTTAYYVTPTGCLCTI